MATRFSPQSGGAASGTFFDTPGDFFGGVAGSFATTLSSFTMVATGAATQYWIEPFDVTVNLAPIYVDTHYVGSIGTMTPTLNSFVLSASEVSAYYGTMAPTLGAFTSSFTGAAGLPAFGTMNPVLGGFAMNFSGAHITPINGTMNATLSSFSMIAGLEFIGKKTSSVLFREKQSTGVYVR